MGYAIDQLHKNANGSGRETRHADAKIVARGVNVHYGEKHALKDVR